MLTPFSVLSLSINNEVKNILLKSSTNTGNIYHYVIVESSTLELETHLSFSTNIHAKAFSKNTSCEKGKILMQLFMHRFIFLELNDSKRPLNDNGKL